MYYIKGFGTLVVKNIVSIQAFREDVVISMIDGEQYVSPADYDETLLHVNLARAVENARTHQEMLDKTDELWRKYAAL